jgi:hypothetical protein
LFLFSDELEYYFIKENEIRLNGKIITGVRLKDLFKRIKYNPSRIII